MRQLDERTIKRIFSLLEQGYQKASIARILRINRSSVQVYAKQRQDAIDKERNDLTEEKANARRITRPGSDV